MAYFPDKQAVQIEIQEQTNNFDLSKHHLTTCNFFEPLIAYVRDNTTRERWIGNTSVFARPLPMQTPIMGEAKLELKTFFVPYRTLSNQWHNFITRSPHIPANGNTPIQVAEMPYYTNLTLSTLFKTTKYSTQTTGTLFDFKDENGNKYIFTSWGRHCIKILHQLGYKLICKKSADQKNWKHINALRLLAFAKVYCDYYYSSQYDNLTAASINVQALFNYDDQTALELTATDIDNIFDLTQASFYNDDYFVSQWDNPASPNDIASSFGTISLTDITMKGNDMSQSYVTNLKDVDANLFGTAYLYPAHNASDDSQVITQYAIDSLKKLNDYCKRYQLAGIRSIDRYLARFGVLLTAEKLRRSEYYGKQETYMQFGAIYSTAETTGAVVGDYAGQGIINSDGQEHKEFTMEELKDLGCIIEIFQIIPHIGYCQGIDRNNLRSDPESYFNGIFDTLGTQATSASELYISNDATSGYGDEGMIDHIFGYIARGAHNKLALDTLSGDFMIPSMNGGNIEESPWHMFRMFNDAYWNGNYGVVHSPYFASAIDKEQYLRIFNTTKEEAGDHFVVLFKHNIEADIHAKPIYDTYDFDSEGKKIIMNGLGPRLQ